MFLKYITRLVGWVGLVACTSAYADIILIATMTNAAENPPAVPTLTTAGAPRPASFGSATFVLNDARTALSVFATVFNIDFTGSQTADTNDNLTVAHIHAGPNVTPLINGPVVWGFFGTPFNNTDPNDGALIPFANGVGGTFSGVWNLNEGNNTNLTAQLPNILNGRSYINFHTVQFPGGEVRGTLLVVPEPSSLALLGLGALGLFGFGMRRKHGHPA